MTPLRLEPPTSRSRVKHSTTEPLLSKDDNFFENVQQTMYYSTLMADSNRLRVKWLIFKLIPHLSATSKTNLDHPDVIPESFCY